VALEALVGLVSLRAKRGDTQSAFELLLIALNHPACDQEIRNRTEKLRAELTVQLTTQQADVAQEQARAKTFEAAVDEVLKRPAALPFER
jgi:hypothetical protein